MRTVKDSSMYPEAAAHCRRVAELCRRADGKQVTADLLFACRDLDNAMEFAAYEGTSLPSAIAGFLGDADAIYDPAITAALRRLAIPCFRPDLTAQLPVLPAAASKLMRISADDASVADLEKIAASDPVLAAVCWERPIRQHLAGALKFEVSLRP